MSRIVIGQHYGMLTPVRIAGRNKQNVLLYDCQCDCGGHRTVIGASLKKRVRHCGCQRKYAILSKIVIGKKYERLTVLRHVGHDSHYRSLYECRCDCGTIKTIPGAYLKGVTKSCGCLVSENARDRMRSRKRLSVGEASLNHLIHTMRKSASLRGLMFTLTRDQIKDLTQRNCHYCGRPPSQLAARCNCNGQFLYNGLDRVENSIGYIIENVVACCKICNRAKSVLSVQEFLSWVKSVYDNSVARIEPVVTQELNIT
jgi:hypothetical protein